MGSQTEDPRRSGARVGQPGEQRRTSQENAGSTEGGGTRNAQNDRGQVAKDDGITRDDIEAGNDSSSQSGQIGSKDRERSGSTRSRNP
jgi:hypothetical protein